MNVAKWRDRDLRHGHPRFPLPSSGEAAREVLLAAHHPSPKPASSTETSLVPTISGLRCTYSPATRDKPTDATARRIGCR